MASLIRQKLVDGCAASLVNVQDTSGGCGAFFSIYVVSPVFEGKRIIEQHRMVKDLLKEEVVQLHGLTIATATPEGHVKNLEKQKSQ